MKRFLLLLSLLYVLRLPAQIWCHPGATWHTTAAGMSYSGYIKFSYLYDTTISGKNCNKIQKMHQGVGTGGPYLYYKTIYTYTASNTVFIKDVTGTTSNFDTLFYFGSVGDKWHLAPSSWTSCVNSSATIQDTGRANIQGQWLRWIKVLINSTSCINCIDTVYERMGCLNRYFYYPGDICPPGLDMEEGGPLRCYSDNQIPNYKHNYVNACNYYYSTGVNEMEAPGTLAVFPNPVSSVLTVSRFGNGSQRCHLVVRDPLGREVMRADAISIDVSGLQAGLYFLEVSTEAKRHRTRFLKE